jgi:prepilin-type N-terminal cleavage/methylation domain-containing protein
VSGRRGSGSRPCRTAGFTLVEVVTVLVISAVLGGALTSLVVSQQRFYSRSDDLVLAQQSLRSSVDLMASELRMAGPGDVLLATPDSVAVRFDLLRAVVCDTLGGDDVGLFVYDSVTNANVPSRFRGTAWSSPWADGFAYADGVTPSWAADATVESTCLANGARPQGTPAPDRFRRASGWTAGFGQTPERGSIVRWYGRLSYRLGRSTSVGGADALWRNGQELVAPFERGGAFEYVLADGTVVGSVGTTSLPEIRAIRIAVTATGRGPFGARRPVTYDIPLRN